MQSQLCFFVSVAFSLVAWGIIAARYIWPELRLRQRAEALRALLILHSFRFIGLAFLVPGVVSTDLPSAFAGSAAYGDIFARHSPWFRCYRWLLERALSSHGPSISGV